MDKEKLKIENWAIKPVSYEEIMRLYKKQEQEQEENNKITKEKICQIILDYFEKNESYEIKYADLIDLSEYLAKKLND